MDKCSVELCQALVHLRAVFCHRFVITHTNSCRTSYENRILVKFSDDAVLLSLLQASESVNDPGLPKFVV